MTADIVQLGAKWHCPEEAEQGNGAREMLLQIIGHMEVCAACSSLSVEEKTDTILGSLWIEGFKVCPLEDKDCTE